MPAPCVETHDRGCVPESEYEALADEAAVGHARTASFRNQWGLAAIGADRAYANLELRLGPDAKPGAGVVVGVLDTGIDRAHPAFRNTRVSERILAGASDEDGSRFSHGTAVASIVAGNESPRYGTDASGIAWGADLAVFAIPLGVGDGTYRRRAVGRLGTSADYFAGIFREILAWRDGPRRIDFLNLSLTVQGLIERYGEEDLREPMEPLVAVMAQDDPDGPDDKLVFVWAAGNSHGNSCDPALPECVNGRVEATSVSLLPGLAARFPELQPQTLAVVAIGRDGAIAGLSNRCGIARDYCLAAPGGDVTVAVFGRVRGRDGVRTVGRGVGTSYAAPMVTGGLALMKQLFRGQLSNTDLAARLLETADRSGVYADASVYGRGLMDLGAATAPVGDPVVVAGLSVDGPGALVRETGLHLGGAFGDGLAGALAGREIAAFDSLGAPFWYDFGGFSRAQAGPALSERLAEFRRVSAAEPSGSPAEALRIPLTGAPGEGPSGGGAALHLTRSGASAAARAGHFALAGDGLIASVPVAAGLTASALTSETAYGETPANGAALAWRPPGSALGLSAGWLDERRSLLGTVSRGAFGRVRGSAAFAGIESGTALGGWLVGGSAEVGTIRARTRGGVLERMSPLVTSAFAVRATRRIAGGGAFGVSLSQPLRVEDGYARFAIPVGRTKSGRVVRERVTVGAAPDGRQIDLALHWQHPVPAGELRLGATLSRHPGHRSGAGTEAILLSGWRAAF
ncbi:MAG: S8 family serine peptidase [Defluviicoccus sp.]|nr:S8 family serine peptidase [Defluviicoccus sp.]